MPYSADIYREKLYPLQDGVLKMVSVSRLPFFLTGGTALSRFYFNHRYSEDLDFFLNDAPDYLQRVEQFYELLVSGAAAGNYLVDESQKVSSELYHRFVITREEVALKIDLVNDIPFRVTEPWLHQDFGLIDSWENILSNKIAAIYRFAARDIADIHEIALQRKFNWGMVLYQARQKELGIDSRFVSEIIASFPAKKMKEINWIKNYDPEIFIKDLSRIAHDILIGADNSLVFDNGYI